MTNIAVPQSTTRSSMIGIDTILLTGATGFLGSHLLEALLGNGYKVIILKRSTSSTWRINHLLNRVRSYDLDRVSLNEVYSDNPIDTVIHLATFYRKYASFDEVAEMVSSNVTFPVELLENGIRHNLRYFINTGTFFECDCSVFPISEYTPNKPYNFYAKTKLMFESILSSYQEQINILTLRLFSPYGERDNNKLIPMLIQKSLLGEKIDLSNGFQKLDFIYASDVIHAYLKALNRLKVGKYDYRIYNIGSGVGVSIREIVFLLEQLLGRSLEKSWSEVPKIDIPVVIADIARAKEELDWAPANTIGTGLAKTLQYYRNLGVE